MKGVYLIGYIETKEGRLLESPSSIKSAVLSICNSIGLNIVGSKYHVFGSTNGVTYCFILSQSHFVVHTWPEESRVFFDIFTCNEDIDKKKCINLLEREFKGSAKEVKKVEYR